MKRDKQKKDPSVRVVVPICNLSTLKAKAGGSKVGQFANLARSFIKIETKKALGSMPTTAINQ